MADDSALVGTLLRWFDAHERPLPWRSTTPWGVLVSEFMLQQTPVERVLPVWTAWMDRWPDPPSLARASLADALRAWGRLGYPRRATRLHAAAVTITDDHGGMVPPDAESLRALPGVGEYTAAAVQAFAFGRRAIVMDTNVRRVIARSIHGQASPSPHVTTSERARANDLWPRTHGRSSRWSAAVMEFGALVCTARAPECATCPIQRRCRWRASGYPPASTSLRPQPQFAGSDREARGRIMAVLRDSHDPVAASALADSVVDADQRERALAGLLADGLVVARGRDRYALPD